jgi:hypothetical protein
MVALVVRPPQGDLKARKDGTCIKLERVYFDRSMVSLQALIAVSLPCSLDLTAYNKAGHAMRSQTIEYTPKFGDRDRLISTMLSVPVDIPYASWISVSGNILPIDNVQFGRIYGLLLKLSVYVRNATDNVVTIVTTVVSGDVRYTPYNTPEECQY